MLEDRNRTTHCYDEDIANEIIEKILNTFYFEIRLLKNTLTLEYNEQPAYKRFGINIEYYEMIKEALLKITDIQEVIIYGSRATGRAAKGSDIDLAIKGPNITHDVLLKTLHELDELPLAYKFDLVNYNSTTPELKEQIDKYGREFM